MVGVIGKRDVMAGGGLIINLLLCRTLVLVVPSNL